MRYLTMILVCCALVTCRASERPAPTHVALPSPTDPGPPLVAASPAPTPAIRPTVQPSPAITLIQPTPVPPTLLADVDPLLLRAGFGPATRSQQWLVARNEGATFSLLALRGQQSRAAQPTSGEPLSWSPEGALLLFTSPEAPNAVWALEPTTGITTTVLTATVGPIGGLAWLQTAIVYAAAEPDALVLLAMDERKNAQIVARLPERRLVPGGLLSSPDRRTAALLVAGTISPTLELYLFDNLQRQLMLVDVNEEGGATARAVWSPQGELAYSLGAELRRYHQASGSIGSAGFSGQPYDWLGGGLLAGRADGALVRWRDDQVQPFDTGSGPLIASAAQAVGRNEAVLLIGQQIWRVTVP